MNYGTSIPTFVILAVSSCALAGCGEGDGGAASSAAANPELFAQTVVHLNADGTHTEHTVTLTAAQLAAQNEARLKRVHYTPALAQSALEGQGVGTTSEAISVEVCQFDSVELWDHAGATGSTICFSGAGNAYLPDYKHTYCSRYGCYALGTWDGAVRSYWGSAHDTLGDPSWSTGEDGYFIGGPPSDVVCKELFSSRATAPTNAGSCAQRAYGLTLTD